MLFHSCRRLIGPTSSINLISNVMRKMNYRVVLAILNANTKKFSCKVT